MAPTVSHAYKLGLIEAVAYEQTKVFETAMCSRRPKASCPRRRSSHAICAAVDEALKAKETGERKTILFNLSGHGYFDMAAYDAYLSGKLEDYDHPEEAIAASICARLPKVE